MAKAAKAAKPAPAEKEDSKELVAVEQATAIAAFSNREAFTRMLDDIRRAAREAVPANADMSNKADRDKIRSIAAKIPKVKTRIDAWGAELVEEKRKEVQAMDALRKEFKDDLDALKDEVRKPLTDWEEAEKKRVEQITNMITSIRELGKPSFGETVEQIKNRLASLPTHPLDWYAEYKDEAQIALDTAFETLTAAKTAAENAEKDRQEREAQSARLRELEEREAKQQAESMAKETLRVVKALGNGILDDEPCVDTGALLDALRQIKPSVKIHGEAWEDIAEAKNEAFDKLQTRVEIEAEARAKQKAEEDARRRQDEELAAAKRQAQEAEERARRLEQEEIDRRDREAKAAEQVDLHIQLVRDGEAYDESRPADIVTTATLLPADTGTPDDTISPEAREAQFQEAMSDIADALVGQNRAGAPGAVMSAINEGKIRHVIFAPSP